MPSIVAEIGAVVEKRMKMMGLLKAPEMSAADLTRQRAGIADD